MSDFKFLGHPTQQQVQDLKRYLNNKYGQIDLQIKAIQKEIDNLTATMTHLMMSESTLGSQTAKLPDTYSLVNYIKTPQDYEDHSYFESHKYESSKTGNVVDLLTRPWVDHIKRESDGVTYKIKKIKYIIEQKNIQLQLLTQTKSDTRDE